MPPHRFFRAAGPVSIASIAWLALLAVFPAVVHAQEEFNFARASTAAREQARTELEEIYSQGAQKLAPPWRGLRVLDDAAVFIRAETAAAGKNQVSIWTDRELPVPGYFEKEKPYVSIRERFIADCSARRLGLAEWVYYSGRYGSGAVVTRDRNAQPEMNESLPDSLEEQIRGVACPKPAPKPAPKPKKAVKPKTDEEKAAEAKDAPKKDAPKPEAKATSKETPKQAPKQAPKQTSKEVSKQAAKETGKTVPRESWTPVRRSTPPRTMPPKATTPQTKKPAPDEDAGKTTTAGRR